MKISDLISMTVKNLLRRKTRTLLTVAGVIVGTCSIVLMVSLGIGQTEALEQSISQMGDLTLIEIYNYNSNSGVTLNEETMRQILNMDGVKGGTPFWDEANMSLQLYSGKKDRYQMYLRNVRGIYADQLENMDFQLAEGELLPLETESGSYLKNKKVRLLMGNKMAYEFYDSKASGEAAYRWEGMLDANGNQLEPFVDVMEDELTLILRNEQYDEQGNPLFDDLRLDVEISGLLGSTDPNVYNEHSYSAYMDIRDLQQLYREYREAFELKDDENTANMENPSYRHAQIKAESIDDVEAVDQAIKDMGFETYSLNSIREPMMEQMQQQQLFLGGIGAISLLVAAIGISNTMVMSIYERTREIGIMKVLGCKLGNIRSIFLMEAGLIGFFGGLAGVGISYGLSYGLNYLTSSGAVNANGLLGSMLGGYGSGGSLSVIPLWLAAAAVLFATIIGLLSGFSPANRAVKISALEAIKHE